MSVDQSVDMDYCHLQPHTMMILLRSSIGHSWLVCLRLVQRKLLCYCLKLIHFPFQDPNRYSLLTKKGNNRISSQEIMKCSNELFVCFFRLLTSYSSCEYYFFITWKITVTKRDFIIPRFMISTMVSTINS